MQALQRLLTGGIKSDAQQKQIFERKGKKVRERFNNFAMNFFSFISEVDGKSMYI